MEFHKDLFWVMFSFFVYNIGLPSVAKFDTI